MQVEKWTGNEAISVNGIIEVLNNAFKYDAKFMQELIKNRISCNKKLRDHPTIQVHCYNDSSYESPRAGFLGLLNGLIGVDVNNTGPITALFDDNGDLIGFKLTDTETTTARVKRIKK